MGACKTLFYDRTVDAVVGIESGSLLLGNEVRRELEYVFGYPIRYVEARKRDSSKARSDFVLPSGMYRARVWIVEDVGSSAKAATHGV